MHLLIHCHKNFKVQSRWLIHQNRIYSLFVNAIYCLVLYHYGYCMALEITASTVCKMNTRPNWTDIVNNLLVSATFLLYVSTSHIKAALSVAQYFSIKTGWRVKNSAADRITSQLKSPKQPPNPFFRFCGFMNNNSAVFYRWFWSFRWTDLQWHSQRFYF